MWQCIAGTCTIRCYGANTTEAGDTKLLQVFLEKRERERSINIIVGD